MDIKQLQAIVINALEDVKAVDIVLYDTTKLTSMFDRLMIASGTSGRQTRALAASVREKVRDAGGKIVGIEGEKTGEWVLVDLGDMVVHIMQHPIRSYYHLEEIWGGKKVDIAKAKVAPVRKTAVRKTATAQSPEDKGAVKKRSSATKAAVTDKKTGAKAKPEAKAKPDAKAKPEAKAEAEAKPKTRTSAKAASSKEAGQKVKKSAEEQPAPKKPRAPRKSPA